METRGSWNICWTDSVCGRRIFICNIHALIYRWSNKQTRLFFFTYFFCSFIPSVHRSRTKSHGGLFFSVGTADFTVISTSNTQTALGFKRWIKKSCFLFWEREFTGEPGTSNKEKRVNKRSPGTTERVGEDLSFHSANTLNAKVSRVWIVGGGEADCAAALKCFEPTSTTEEKKRRARRLKKTGTF